MHCLTAFERVVDSLFLSKESLIRCFFRKKRNSFTRHFRVQRRDSRQLRDNNRTVPVSTRGTFAEYFDRALKTSKVREYRISLFILPYRSNRRKSSSCSFRGTLDGSTILENERKNDDRTLRKRHCTQVSHEIEKEDKWRDSVLLSAAIIRKW